MLYSLRNGVFTQGSQSTSSEAGGPIVEILSTDQLDESHVPQAISRNLLDQMKDNKGSRFESYPHVDFLCVNLWKNSLLPFNSIPCFLFLQSDRLQLFAQDTEVQAMMQHCLSSGENRPAGLLYAFLERCLAGDADKLQEIEQGISHIENDILEHRLGKNYTKKIIFLRRQLRMIKRHYGQIRDLCCELQANPNGLFHESDLRLVHILEGRAERLYQAVLGLLDYVTELREAYQSEVDINLNRTMRLLTVVTIIFLPLTLITGWYGMNFEMPEFSFPYSYPLVAAVCLLIAAACILYFKKKHWF